MVDKIRNLTDYLVTEAVKLRGLDDSDALLVALLFSAMAVIIQYHRRDDLATLAHDAEKKADQVIRIYGDGG